MTHKERMIERRAKQLVAVAEFIPVFKTGWRARAEAKATKPQVVQATPDGGYRTLHPTRGWRKVSPARLRAWGLTPGVA